jgi:hypothetical protein
MTSTIRLASGKAVLLLTGMLLYPDAWAGPVTVRCVVSEVTFQCAPLDNSFSFKAHMEQPIGSGSDPSATMTFSGEPWKYKGNACDVDAQVDYNVTAQISCPPHGSATLQMSHIYTTISGPDHGTGSFN